MIGMGRPVRWFLFGSAIALGWLGPASAQTLAPLSLRGHVQQLHLYGRPGGHPVIVTSGDGGWVRLAPQVAEILAARGYFVVGFDAKAYLASFTTRTSTLSLSDEPGDYATLAAFASRNTHGKVLLVGISEGAGLSVLAATDRATQAAIAGVVALGLPDVSELGWRWKDSLIYLTHGVPDEPTFATAAIIEKVAPVPLAAVHSTQDEFTPLATAKALVERARPPRRFWEVRAANHRFSDNLEGFRAALLEALAWVLEQPAH